MVDMDFGLENSLTMPRRKREKVPLPDKKSDIQPPPEETGEVIPAGEVNDQENNIIDKC